MKGKSMLNKFKRGTGMIITLWSSKRGGTFGRKGT
uniref:Uncharacterized protein n=1 Tax=Arundo donax TaxID=35708 RepID=A0A0A8YJJ5_ARUDO